MSRRNPRQNIIPESERGEIQLGTCEEPGKLLGTPYTVEKHGETMRIAIQFGELGNGAPCFHAVQIWPNGAVSDLDIGKAYAHTFPAIRAWLDKTFKKK